jgi:hypothetical protein
VTVEGLTLFRQDLASKARIVTVVGALQDGRVCAKSRNVAGPLDFAVLGIPRITAMLDNWSARRQVDAGGAKK